MKRHTLLLATAAMVTASTAWAGDVRPVVDTVLEQVSDLRGMVFTDDGKLYLSGNAGATRPELTTVVLRVNADGTLDDSFGEGGITEVDVAHDAELPNNRRAQQSFGITELSGGDLLVTVHGLDLDSGQSVFLLRFDSDGNQKVAPEWGDEKGRVEVPFGWADADNAEYSGAVGPVDSAWNLYLDPSASGDQERVVIMGHGPAPKGSGRTDLDRYVVRLMAADGSPDPTFNGGQPVHYHSFGEAADSVRRASIEQDGSIVTAGFTDLGEGLRNHVVLLRILPDGTYDPDFGNFVYPEASAALDGIDPRPGVAMFNPFQADGGEAEAYAAALMPDGSYVTGGPGEATAEGGTSSMGYAPTANTDLVSFKVRGNALDMSFGNNGTVAIQSEGAARESYDDRTRDLVGLPDGRTVHAGQFGGVPAVVVLTADGALDTEVDGDGIIEMGDSPVTVQFNSAFVSPDGKRVALTSDFNAEGTRLVILDVE